MKPVLLALDSFGEKLKARPACSTLFEVCDLEDDSWSALFETLVRLGWSGDNRAARLCVIADLNDLEGRRRFEELPARLQERFHRAPDFAYVILPKSVGDGEFLREGSPWKRVFVLARHVDGEDAVEPATRVLAVHGIPEMGALVDRRSGSPGAVRALAWELKALGRPVVGSGPRETGSLLRETMDAMDVLGAHRAGEKGLELARGELWRCLHEVRGGSVILVLPKESIEKRQQDELQSWVEQVMSLPCEIVQTQGDDAWLYIETPLESSPRGDNLSHEASPTPRPLLPSAATPPSRRCPDCGVALSEPRLILPHEEDRSSWNSSWPRKTCPTCGRLNAKAWWVCWNHGKFPVLIPIDKVRCPDCILWHHEDRYYFPLTRISIRPDYKEPANCPNCENVRHRDPGHPIFEIPEDLMRFYRDGVNGHDSAHFKAIARRAGLLGGCYCPNCGTLLIPVDHRKLQRLEGQV